MKCTICIFGGGNDFRSVRDQKKEVGVLDVQFFLLGFSNFWPL